MSENTWKIIAGLSAAAATGYGASKIIGGSSKNEEKPEKWIRVGTISELIIYPVKSLQGISIDEAVATIIGLKATDNEFLRDRTFLVVDSRSVFQTQRTIPRMSLVSVMNSRDTLTLKAEGKQPVTFTYPKDTPENRRSCRIFDDHVAHALDCGDEVGKWLDEFLEKKGLRLYYHSITDKTQRPMNALQKKFPTFVPTDKGAFHDQTSYMLMAEESISELNTQLKSPVTHKSFRPSIMIKGIPEPFAEDFWTFVRIGQGEESATFKMAKPCTRCKLTTVIPETGEFNEEGEPLKTLTGMKRKVGNEKVNALVKNQGVLGTQLGLYGDLKNNPIIRVGDPVYAAAL